MQKENEKRCREKWQVQAAAEAGRQAVFQATWQAQAESRTQNGNESQDPGTVQNERQNRCRQKEAVHPPGEVRVERGRQCRCETPPSSRRHERNAAASSRKRTKIVQ